MKISVLSISDPSVFYFEDEYVLSNVTACVIPTETYHQRWFVTLVAIGDVADTFANYVRVGRIFEMTIAPLPDSEKGRVIETLKESLYPEEKAMPVFFVSEIDVPEKLKACEEDASEPLTEIFDAFFYLDEEAPEQ